MPQAVAGHDHTEELIVIAEHRIGKDNVPRRQCIAYLGGTHHDTAFRSIGFRPYDIQSQLFGQCRRLFRSTEIGTKPVVVTEQDGIAPELTYHIFLQIFFRGQTAECLGKRQNLDMVHANAFQKCFLLFHRGKQTQIPGIILQNIARMRPKCDDHAFIATCSCLFYQSA